MTRRPQRTPTTRTWHLAAVAIALLAGAMLAAPWIPGARPRDLLLAKWRRQIEICPDDEAQLLLARITNLGDVALPILVEALGHPRNAVSNAAAQNIRRQIDRWRWLRASESSPKAADLAAELAGQSALWPPSRRRLAAQIAERLLDWPLDSNTVDASRFVANCEQVLRGADNSPTAGGLADIEESQLQQPGDELAAATTTSPEDNQDQAAEPAATPDHRIAAEPSPWPQSLDDPLADAVARSAPPAPSGSLRRVPAPFSWSRLTDREVMQRLHASEFEVARAAEAELRRRGFQNLHIRLAYKLAHPDARLRRQFAEDLPRLSGVDARPWLLWLSDDESAEVRSLAASILATSQDPRLHKQLEEVTRNESSPAVRERLDQIYQAQRSLAEERDVR